MLVDNTSGSHCWHGLQRKLRLTPLEADQAHFGHLFSLKSWQSKWEWRHLDHRRYVLRPRLLSPWLIS